MGKFQKHFAEWKKSYIISSVQFSLSVVSNSLKPHEMQYARRPCPSPTRSLPKLMCIESVMPSNHLILCRPLLLLPSIFPSIRVFSNESALHIRWPKYWSFSFNISPSNEHPGLIFFRMDWLDLLAVQGTLKSLLQHHSSKTSILQHSVFFIVQLSHPYMTTGKTIALTRPSFVDKVMPRLLNMLSLLVITFLPRFSSVQFSCSVMSDSLWPHEPQHARPLCPSPTPRVHPNPCPSSWWCHQTISSSVILSSSCPQSFPASGSFQMSQLFASGVQSAPPKEQASFNFMAAVIICSDFGAQKNKGSHCFHSFPIYFPWSDGTRCHDLSFLNVEL